MSKSHHKSSSHRSKRSGGSSPSPASTARIAQSGSADSGYANSLSTKERVQAIHTRTTQKDEEEHALKRKLVPRLAKRAYHLEDGNSWCQDWIQYQKNTHPVFGICMHHRLHPIRLPQRVIILVGSIAFGFAVTNCVYLGYLGNENVVGVNTVYDITGKLAEVQQKYTNIELEQSMVFLLTVGSFAHSMFDMLIWYLMACFCFRPGGIKTNKLCQTFGIYAAVLVVIAAVVAATTVAVVRLSHDEEKAEMEYQASLAEQFAEQQLGEEDSGATSHSTTTFVVGYFLELVFALFVFYFMTSTVFFSGILGCGRVPVFGGRPYEIRKAAAKKANKTDNQQSDDDEESLEGMQGYDI